MCVLDPAIEKKASAYRALLSEARELDANGDGTASVGEAFDQLSQDDIDGFLCRNFTTYPDEVCFDLTTPATFYHSASVTYDFSEQFRLTVGASNLFDTRPPLTSQVGGDGIQQFGTGVLYSQYDLLGRRFFVNVNVRY